jgi:hypothetical protein
MMMSQLEFDPGDYHLRLMIERMEREGRSEHAIEYAVRTAAAPSPAAETPVTKNHRPGKRGFNRWTQRLRPSGSHRAGSAVRCR